MLSSLKEDSIFLIFSIVLADGVRKLGLHDGADK